MILNSPVQRFPILQELNKYFLKAHTSLHVPLDLQSVESVFEVFFLFEMCVEIQSEKSGQCKRGFKWGFEMKGCCNRFVPCQS